MFNEINRERTNRNTANRDNEKQEEDDIRLTPQRRDNKQHEQNNTNYKANNSVCSPSSPLTYCSSSHKTRHYRARSPPCHSTGTQVCAQRLSPVDERGAVVFVRNDHEEDVDQPANQVPLSTSTAPILPFRSTAFYRADLPIHTFLPLRTSLWSVHKSTVTRIWLSGLCLVIIFNLSQFLSNLYILAVWPLLGSATALAAIHFFVTGHWCDRVLLLRLFRRWDTMLIVAYSIGFFISSPFTSTNNSPSFPLVVYPAAARIFIIYFVSSITMLYSVIFACLDCVPRQLVHRRIALSVFAFLTCIYAYNWIKFGFLTDNADSSEICIIACLAIDRFFSNCALSLCLLFGRLFYRLYRHPNRAILLSANFEVNEERETPVVDGNNNADLSFRFWILCTVLDKPDDYVAIGTPSAASSSSSSSSVRPTLSSPSSPPAALDFVVSSELAHDSNLLLRARTAQNEASCRTSSVLPLPQ